MHTSLCNEEYGSKNPPIIVIFLLKMTPGTVIDLICCDRQIFDGMMKITIILKQLLSESFHRLHSSQAPWRL